jgi:Tol biopolymer transport system component/C-terminal processing protease CtpA/Prc
MLCGASIIALPLGAQLPSTSSEGASWMRYPAISPDGSTIVFEYKGDLYRVASTGGQAAPLTAHPAHDFMPVWSHDGKQIAFASDRHGNFDIYVMPATGGEPRRLTYHSAAEYPYTFTADDRQVIFGAARMDAASNREYPTVSQPELYQVPAAGGRPTQIITTPAVNVQTTRDGQQLIYEDIKGFENEWRKHHVSAIARDIWIYDRRTGKHRKITTFAGEDRNPVLSKDERSFYYLSEESGSFNVHEMSIDGGKSTQLTSFRQVPVRFLSSTNSGTLCFGFDGQIYTMAPNARPAKVAITILADDKGNKERIMAVSRGARGLAVSPNGKEIAFVYRGDVFVAGADGGGTKRITSTPETETDAEFSPDGSALIYASERGGKWAIYEARKQRSAEPYFYASTVVKETPVISNDKQNTQPTFSPDGKEIAYIENRNNLRVYNIASKETRTLLTEKELFGDNHGFHWSPDGKWILFDYDVPGIAPGEVGLVRADGTGKVVNLTESGFNDGRGEWIMDGKAMMWFSNRDGLRSVAQSGAAQQDVYAMFFDRGAWERFNLTKAEFALVKDQEEKLAKAKSDSSRSKSDTARKPPLRPLVLDLDGIQDRRARLTIASAALGNALMSKDGETLYYLARYEKGMNLWSTNVRTRETKMVLPLDANSASMEWGKDQKEIFMVADGAISRFDPEKGKRTPIALNGETDFDTDAERAAMFDHVWRRTRDTFYSRGYHGIDWVGIRPIYAKYLPYIGDNYDFAEMLSEMMGELNVSHSGARYSPSNPDDDATASLGVFLDQSYAGPGAKVTEVIREGPLDRDSVPVRVGSIIESVDGHVIAPNEDISEFLNRKAGKNILLTIINGTAKSEAVVKPVSQAAEGRLLYTRWVRRNQAEVDSVSHGQLGYVHIPGMNDGAYRATFEDIMGKYATRKGVVVDTRFNGGGDLVADLAMFLSGKRFFNYTTDTRSTGFEPNFRWTKPSVAMANESNYSDGHCFAYAYKAQKIGPLVGMPTPGTCTFAGWESLEDGIRWGVPGTGVKDATTGKYLENSQTVPDIVVRDDYDVAAKGRDQQLEAAVSALMNLIPQRGGTQEP